MRQVIRYIENLKKRSQKHLESEYNISNFNISEFELINFFLIDKALNNRISLFIKTLEQEQASLVYFPSIVSVAISLFFKNYCDDTTNYEIGEIIQKNGVRYKIEEKNNEEYILWSEYQGGTKKIIPHKHIKKYIVTNADLSNRKVITRFEDYRKFFKTIFNVDDFPSKFTYKAAILVEKKDFLNEMKQQNYTDIELQKAIPMQWVTKNGRFESPYIPIEPMIYLLPDYETFKDFVLPKDDKIEAVISIGQNKYKHEILRKIKRDIYFENIPCGILLGNDDIDDSANQFLKWHWTYPEFAHISNRKMPEVEFNETIDTKYIEQINYLYEYIFETEERYSINLASLNIFKKFLFSLTIPSHENSRMLNHLEYIRHRMLQESRDLIEEQLFNQNKNPNEEIKTIQNLIESVFSSFSNRKLDYLNSNENYDIILVPELNISTWKKEFEFERKIKIQTLNNFLKIQNNFSNTKTIILLSIFGYCSPYYLIKVLKKTSHKFKFLTYPEESEDFKNLINKYENNLMKEYSSEDRTKLSGIKFKARTKPVKISDLIEEISSRADKEAQFYDYEISEVFYLINFYETDEELILEGSKSILLETEKRKEKVSNLRPDDKVRIYLNASKEKLYEIARSEDKEGRFNEIEYNSNFWKLCLNNYFKSRIKNRKFYDEESLLDELQKEGANIKRASTIKKWLDLNDEEKFPNSPKNLIAIKNLVKDQKLDLCFDSILNSRRIFRGIMIALGRDLSDEIMDYIISENKTKGKILEKFSDTDIKGFIKESAPLRTVSNINIYEEDE